MKNKTMNLIVPNVLQRLSLLTLACIFSLGLLAQSAGAQSVSGTVTDEQGEPLVGVSVVVKGTTTGAATDIDGLFTFDKVASDAVLVFSYIGYLTREVAVENRTSLQITLYEDVQTLEDVVVVGYAVWRRSTLPAPR